MIQLTNINKSFQVGDENVHALQQVNTTITSGKLSFLVGESGSGKSTLLHILGGMDREFSGTYIFGDKDVSAFSEKQWSEFRRTNIGFIFQSFNLIPHLTALENIEISMTITNTSKRKRKKRATELLKLVGLEGRANHLPSELSGGQKQRVAIARALANDPDVIFADEPTGALDSENSQQVMDILKEISNQGKTVLVVTHSKEFFQMADVICELKDGEIVHEEHRNTQNSIQTLEQKEPIKNKKLGWRATAKLAYHNIRMKKWRTFLTACGASIGIFGIMLILALASGINEKIASVYGEASISDLIAVSEEEQNLMDMQEMEKFREIDNVEAVYAYTIFQMSIETEDGERDVLSADSLLPAKYENTYGDDYVETGKYPKETNELLIPDTVAIDLFGNPENAVGQRLKVVAQFMSLKDVFRTMETTAVISGVTKGNQVEFFNTIGLSYDFANVLMDMNPQTENKALQFVVVPKAQKHISPIIKEVESLNYKAMTEGDATDELMGYVSIISLAISLLSGVSLLVSSIMIGIVLYVSVLERTREIGTLKALGTYQADIRKIFISEGLLIGSIGGAIGIGGAFIVSFLGNRVLAQYFDKTDLNIFLFSPLQVTCLLLFSSLLGVLASFVPAFKAAKLNPISALKYE